MTTGHTNPLDAARQELNNRHADLVAAMKRLISTTNQAVFTLQAGGPVRMQDIHSSMVRLEERRDLYAAVLESVRDLEEVHTLSEH